MLAGTTAVVRLVGALHRGPLLWTLDDGGHDATVPEQEASDPARSVPVQRPGGAGSAAVPRGAVLWGRYRALHHSSKAGAVTPRPHPEGDVRTAMSEPVIRSRHSGCARRGDSVRFARPPPERCGRARKHSFPPAPASSRTGTEALSRRSSVRRPSAGGAMGQSNRANRAAGQTVGSVGSSRRTR